jgi:adhesin transport system membrane fusion protein
MKKISKPKVVLNKKKQKAPIMLMKKNRSAQKNKPTLKIAPLSKSNLKNSQKEKIDTPIKKATRHQAVSGKSCMQSIQNKFRTLVNFLTGFIQGTWLIIFNIIRVFKLALMIVRFLIANLWRLFKVLIPLIIKGLVHLTLELGKYINIYVPKLWHYLKVHIPIWVSWLEKEIPIFLSNVEIWLKKNTPIILRWIEEKSVYLYNLAKSYLGILIEKIKVLFDYTKKNYPTFRKVSIKYIKLGIGLYKKHRPFALKNIKSYFEIKDHPETHENLKDFVTDADHFILHQEPIRGMLIIRVALASIFVLFIWAALTQVDELVKGDGKVVPSSQLQVLQSLDGGVVKAILVKEGEEVKAGQALVEIDTTRFLSSVKENDAQRIALSARAERINSLLENRPFAFPKNLSPDETPAYEQEQRYFVNAKIQLDNQVAASAEQLASAQRELRLTKPLLSSGAVSEVEILRLEREVTRLRGLREQAEFEFKNNLRKDLSDTMAKLNSLSEGSVGLEDRVKQSVIRSPLNGYVKRLHVNTIGGVIGAAKDIVEVVPSEDNLTIEAKVQPKDIGFLRIGQKALVKLTAYDFSIYGGMEAFVDSIGADSITDEKGNSFYIVKVKTHKLQLKKNLPIIPGMQAEVDIQTGSKSILTYLLKPILRAKQAAFTER